MYKTILYIILSIAGGGGGEEDRGGSSSIGRVVIWSACDARLTSLDQFKELAFFPSAPRQIYDKVLINDCAAYKKMQ